MGIFIGNLDDSFNQKIDEKTCKFNRCKDLFTLTLESTDKVEEIINDFEICVSKLREHGSKGVEDDCLMRAIILHAVRAKEFQHCKLEITKNVNKKVDDILSEVKSHFIAVKTNDDLVGSKSNAKQVKFGRRVNAEKEEERENNTSKWRIPKFPSDLKDVVFNSVFHHLNQWRLRAMKKVLSDADSKKFNDGEYLLFPDVKKRPPKPVMEKADDQNKNRYNGKESDWDSSRRS